MSLAKQNQQQNKTGTSLKCTQQNLFCRKKMTKDTLEL